MRAPSIRTRRIAARSSAPVAILLAGLMVWQASDAAFTAETHNSGNSWETSTVSIFDDDGGTSMFQIANLVPMQTGNKCIVVTADSEVAGVVKAYVPAVTANGLQDYLDMKIEIGTGGTFADCTGFTATSEHASESLSTLNTDHGSFTNGILSWTKPVGSDSRTYKFTWLFNTAGLSEAQVNALQGKDVGATFEWELQNT